MNTQDRGRTRPRIAIAGALAAVAAVTGVGVSMAGSPDVDGGGSKPHNKAAAEEHPAGKAAPPSPSPTGQDGAKSERTGPPPDDYGFGEPVDEDGEGEVAAYEPQVHKNTLYVPVTVTNLADDRYMYEVEVLVTGANGFEAVATLSTDVTGVYPGGTWPEEIAVHDSAHPLPEDPAVEITSVSRRLMFPKAS